MVVHSFETESAVIRRVPRNLTERRERERCGTRLACRRGEVIQQLMTYPVAGVIRMHRQLFYVPKLGVWFAEQISDWPVGCADSNEGVPGALVLAEYRHCQWRILGDLRHRNF